MRFMFALQLDFTTSPGGWVVPTKVKVEVEDELGNRKKHAGAGALPS